MQAGSASSRASSLASYVYGTTLGRKNYSTIKEEFDGSITITRRGKRRLIDFQVVLPDDQISSMQRTLDPLSETPSLYVGSSELDYTIIVGIFEDLDTGLPTYGRGEYTLRVRSIM